MDVVAIARSHQARLSPSLALSRPIGLWNKTYGGLFPFLMLRIDLLMIRDLLDTEQVLPIAANWRLLLLRPPQAVFFPKLSARGWQAKWRWPQSGAGCRLFVCRSSYTHAVRRSFTSNHVGAAFSGGAPFLISASR